ncbi:hypothetical protein ON010_g14298 [Phytophthora cinnamomi]|nr:hypothetical protein ON010_g14298 [Phytophthora cinnamomi]
MCNLTSGYHAARFPSMWANATAHFRTRSLATGRGRGRPPSVGARCFRSAGTDSDGLVAIEPTPSGDGERAASDDRIPSTSECADQILDGVHNQRQHK